MEITKEIVSRLIKEQFPQWEHLRIRPVKNSGHDNRTFHIGEEMLARLPSAARYEPQVEKESRWLPFLSKQLSFPITKPIAVGKPTKEYPYSWTINAWIDGETVSKPYDSNRIFAKKLADCLKELQTIDPTGGPKAGAHNFHRGGDLHVYDQETISTIEDLKDQIDVEACTKIWKRALSIKWEKKPVWIHGDVAIGNILVKDNTFAALIDFGMVGIGDPACDLVMAWTFFNQECRIEFIKEMELDKDTWHRAMGWALWKALITYSNPESKRIVQEIINESAKEINN